jgi:hypothetical protein
MEGRMVNGRGGRVYIVVQAVRGGHPRKIGGGKGAENKSPRAAVFCHLFTGTEPYLVSLQVTPLPGASTSTTAGIGSGATEAASE